MVSDTLARGGSEASDSEASAVLELMLRAVSTPSLSTLSRSSNGDDTSSLPCNSHSNSRA